MSTIPLVRSRISGHNKFLGANRLTLLLLSWLCLGPWVRKQVAFHKVTFIMHLAREPHAILKLQWDLRKGSINKKWHKQCKQCACNLSYLFVKVNNDGLKTKKVINKKNWIIHRLFKIYHHWYLTFIRSNHKKKKLTHFTQHDLTGCKVYALALKFHVPFIVIKDQ